MTAPVVFLRYKAQHEPTEAQASAGNYAVKRRRWRSLDVSIECPAGSVRSGRDRNGHEWETRMLYDYGYFRGTRGVDGDHFDVFMGPDPDGAPMVFVVTAMTPGDWTKPDEQKAMVGFASEDDARAAFLAHYDDDRFMGEVRAMPAEEFEQKVKGTARGPIVLLKANVKGHMRGGSFVKPYTTKTPAAQPKGPTIQKPLQELIDDHKQVIDALESGSPAKQKAVAAEQRQHLAKYQTKLKAAAVAYHPQLNDDGKPVAIKVPHTASSPDTWDAPDLAATFVPGGEVPAELNGIPFAPWADAPTSSDEWEHVEGQNADIDEPPLELTAGKHAGAGVVIEEDDGRVWLVAPTNAFGGYKASFPKGTAEMDLSLQANAIKEAWEESGLQVEITGFLMDVERSTSVARYYTARRVGGTPADAGWESQAVHLVPRDQLYQFLNNSNDHGLAEALGAGPAPKKPEPPKSKGLFGW